MGVEIVEEAVEAAKDECPAANSLDQLFDFIAGDVLKVIDEAGQISRISSCWIRPETEFTPRRCRRSLISA